MAIASSMAATTMERSITFSRATASAICKSSSLLALTAIRSLLKSGNWDKQDLEKQNIDKQDFD